MDKSERGKIPAHIGIKENEETDQFDRQRKQEYSTNKLHYINPRCRAGNFPQHLQAIYCQTKYAPYCIHQTDPQTFDNKK